mgnify:CR=1 FL=1
MQVNTLSRKQELKKNYTWLSCKWDEYGEVVGNSQIQPSDTGVTILTLRGKKKKKNSDN